MHSLIGDGVRSESSSGFCSVRAPLRDDFAGLEEFQIHYHNVGKRVYRLQYEEECVPLNLRIWKTSCHTRDTGSTYRAVRDEVYSFSTIHHSNIIAWNLYAEMM